MKLALGTVQFGLNYGINNNAGKPEQSQVNAILASAKSIGIQKLDSSINYGDSLKALAAFEGIQSFQISSKFSSKDKLELSITEQVDQTIQQVNADKLDILYFHNFPDLKVESFQKEFISLKESGKISSLGASIYTIDEFAQVVAMDHIDSIQIPFNLLDPSKEKLELMREAKSKGKNLIARSIFLQGLFFKNLDQFPDKLKPIKPTLQSLHSICDKYHINMMQLALGFGLAQELLDQCLIGVDSKDQLDKNIEAIKTPLAPEVLEEVMNINIKHENLLNPTNWN